MKKTETEKLKIAIEALKECAIPTGAYNQDRLKHAENCLDAVSEAAKKALEEIEDDDDLPCYSRLPL